VSNQILFHALTKQFLRLPNYSFFLLDHETGLTSDRIYCRRSVV
jgi:hypothetical protein